MNDVETERAKKQLNDAINFSNSSVKQVMEGIYVNAKNQMDTVMILAMIKNAFDLAYDETKKTLNKEQIEGLEDFVSELMKTAKKENIGKTKEPQAKGVGG